MNIDENSEVAQRAAVHAALGDPARLAIADALTMGEASPSELQALLDMPSNLMAHHLRVLERAGVVTRHRSEGDRRRSYLTLAPGGLDSLRPAATHGADRIVFVCTDNTARSPLAAALWSDESRVPATSAGTHPAPATHPGTVAVAQHRHIPLTPSAPRHVADVVRPGDLVITVCDAAHEERGAAPGRLHWSIPDPARAGGEAAFDRAVDALAERVTRIAPMIHLIRRAGS
jgi:protein-tyrosine-phosphatase/DNA-binding transcriptional ArsR family regulator